MLNSHLYHLTPSAYMGLIGLLMTVAIMILGAGYFLFGSSNGSITLENKVVSEQGAMSNEQGTTSNEQGAVAQFEAIKNQAESAKDLVEKRAAETMEEETLKTADAPPEKRLPAGRQGTTAPEDQGAAKTTVVPPAVRQPAESAPEGENSEINIIEKKVNFGFGVPAHKRTIDTVVLHSSYNSTGGDVYSVDKVIAIWKSYEVAPHYMIDRKGNVYRLVDDANIAYHAGVSKMPDGRTNVNDFSIGVEILNTKDDKYTDAQYTAVNNLIAYLKGKYSIKTVVGHMDIAPGRKDDPWRFDWKKVK